jgi:hypothetical protein
MTALGVFARDEHLEFDADGKSGKRASLTMAYVILESQEGS